MKKILILIMILFVLLLSSCVISSIIAREYDTYVYSPRALDNAVIQNSNGVFFIFNNTDYQWQTAIEQAVQDEFSKLDIRCEIFSDYSPVNEDSTVYDVYNLPVCKEWNPDYVIYGQGSNLYTYTTGGGVSSLTIEFAILDLNNSNPIVFQMSISAEAKENTFDSFRETRERAAKAIASRFVSEYMKHIK